MPLAAHRVVTGNSSPSEFLGLAIDMCSTIGGGASGRSSKWLLGTAAYLIPRPGIDMYMNAGEAALQRLGICGTTFRDQCDLLLRHAYHEHGSA